MQHHAGALQRVQFETWRAIGNALVLAMQGALLHHMFAMQGISSIAMFSSAAPGGLFWQCMIRVDHSRLL